MAKIKENVKDIITIREIYKKDKESDKTIKDILMSLYLFFVKKEINREE